MENELYIVASMTRNQKVSIITLLFLIAENFSDDSKALYRQKLISQQISFLGVTETECKLFLQSNTVEILKSNLGSLTENQIELLVSMVWELLYCFGQPIYADEKTARISLKKIIGLTEDQVELKFDKIKVLNDFFQPAPEKRNDENPIVNRMIRKAQDTNQSTFSFNNIVFMTIIALAILGLISLCSTK